MHTMREQTVIERQCIKCLETKDINQFQKNKGKHRTVCRPCRNKQQLERRKPEATAENKVEVTENGNTATVTATGRIKTLEHLLEACKVDLSVWRVNSFTANAWEQNSQQQGVTTLYQVKACLHRVTAIATEFPEIHPVRCNLPLQLTRKPVNSGLHTCLVIPDSQNGWRRDQRTGELTPMHDPDCWELALQLASKMQPDKIIMLGDMIDAGELSLKFPSTPDLRFTLQKTIDDLGATLARLRSLCPHSEIYMLEGNHELRLEKAVVNSLISAYGLTQANAPKDAHPVLSFPHLLGLDELGIKWIGGYPDAEVWINDQLVCVHGDLVRSSGGETARAYLKKYRCSVVYGHVHRQEFICETSWVRGKPCKHVAASPGTICKLDGSVPSVNKKMDWQQGLMVIGYDDKDFNIELIPIDNGTMFYRNDRYAA